jgi:hypothetical protein
LPQVEDDNILEVVDVLLIRVNSWGIHPLHETAVIWLSEYCRNRDYRTEGKEFCLPMLVSNARSI